MCNNNFSDVCRVIKLYHNNKLLKARARCLQLHYESSVYKMYYNTPIYLICVLHSLYLSVWLPVCLSVDRSNHRGAYMYDAFSFAARAPAVRQRSCSRHRACSHFFLSYYSFHLIPLFHVVWPRYFGIYASDHAKHSQYPTPFPLQTLHHGIIIHRA